MKYGLLFPVALFLSLSSSAQAQDVQAAIVYSNVHFATSWSGSAPSDNIWAATCGSPRELILSLLTTPNFSGSIATGEFHCDATLSMQETTHLMLGPAKMAGSSLQVGYSMWPGFYWSCQIDVANNLNGSCLVYSTSGSTVGTLQLVYQP
ncbi:MAG: hypothetical protein OEV89_06175 [Desulfobulbaceae bacterium]|nr:hypothetical protein [Desulfobulbaceae bacterium]HIJ90338.1 hypothetical protein [Deltaproteobacteria bacterium]